MDYHGICLNFCDSSCFSQSMTFVSHRLKNMFSSRIVIVWFEVFFTSFSSLEPFDTRWARRYYRSARLDKRVMGLTLLLIGVTYLIFDVWNNETLRKYPPATFLMRQSTSSYTFAGTRVNIPKDQKVWIPIYAIHRDPNIYPEPDVFNPERFNEETVQSRHAMFYLPFGDGPRNCIGARFAVYQSKVGLIKILRNYKVETCEKTPIPYVSDPRAFVLAPKDGIHLKIMKINQA